MTGAIKLGFSPLAGAGRGVLVVFCDDELKFGTATKKLLGPAAGQVARAAKAERFTGKSAATLELPVPEGLEVSRLVVIGTGKAGKLESKDFLKLGGVAMGKEIGRAHV